MDKHKPADGCIRIKLVLSYIGSRYSGWQIQEKPNPPPTIQGSLEKAVATVCGRLVRVHGAGRTDAGVHADAQVAHMDVPVSKAGLNWRKTLNALLPRDISVIEATPAPEDFHARFSAIKKSYTYSLWLEREFVPPRLAPFVFACGPLDSALMSKAMPLLIGCKDFSSLQNAGTDISSTIRTIYELECVSPAELADASGNLLVIRVVADGFLKQMVRNIAGLLVEVGRKRLVLEHIEGIIAGCDRKLSSSTAPAQGLTLTNVYY